MELHQLFLGHLLLTLVVAGAVAKVMPLVLVALAVVELVERTRLVVTEPLTRVEVVAGVAQLREQMAPAAQVS